MFVKQLRIEAELESYPELITLLGKNLEKFVTWVIAQRALHKSEIRVEVMDFLTIYLPWEKQQKQQKRRIRSRRKLKDVVKV